MWYQEAGTAVQGKEVGATPFANGVPKKGADSEGYVVECMEQNVMWLGHSKVGDRHSKLIL